ncbi:MAG: hypothetical protein C4532_02410 [Candidatus Abyssobacteria bacterium SURF_17]|uniref:Uncharacterized protein n=1 Tax=Candidatus Abyssobacteria bacterium SURF_17 TaxID=2093361 RepID=A0A419F7M8_9BACT|nr:MAG: hypothetical protein C4532_02410 [Candidatus Abyssubacteria bacterium SURF_17]
MIAVHNHNRYVLYVTLLMSVFMLAWTFFPPLVNSPPSLMTLIAFGGVLVFPFLLALAVLVGSAMDGYWNRVTMSRLKALMPVPFLLSSFVFIEGLKVPLRPVQPIVPSIYSVLLNDDSDYGVLEWPLSEPFFNRNVLYYQVFHGRKLVTVAGHSSVFPRSQSRTTELIMNSRFYRYADMPEAFFSLAPSAQKQVIQGNRQFFLTNQIKYFIVHAAHTDAKQLPFLTRYAGLHEPVYEALEDGIYLFRMY